jgi:small GTP-binding protein
MITNSQKSISRVVMIGDASVGKTSIINQLVDNSFNISERTTIGLNFKRYSQTIDGTEIQIEILDTAGQERYGSIGPIYYKKLSALKKISISTFE